MERPKGIRINYVYNFDILIFYILGILISKSEIYGVNLYKCKNIKNNINIL